MILVHPWCRLLSRRILLLNHQCLIILPRWGRYFNLISDCFLPSFVWAYCQICRMFHNIHLKYKLLCPSQYFRMLHISNCSGLSCLKVFYLDRFPLWFHHRLNFLNPQDYHLHHFLHCHQCLHYRSHHRYCLQFQYHHHCWQLPHLDRQIIHLRSHKL